MCVPGVLWVQQGISFDTSTKFAPYKILYLVFGAQAIVVGIAVLLWMPDSPVHAKMLTPEERIAAIERVRDDQGGTENRRFKKAQVYETLRDVRTWLIVLTTFLSATSILIRGLFVDSACFSEHTKRRLEQLYAYIRLML